MESVAQRRLSGPQCLISLPIAWAAYRIAHEEAPGAAELGVDVRARVGEILRLARGAGHAARNPVLERANELRVRDGHRRALAAGLPAPEHELVFGDVLNELLGGLAAVALGVLEDAA
jgi:hypothetical protein